MKKLFLLMTLGSAGLFSAQSISPTGSSGGDYTYTYTSTCNSSTSFTSLGGELTLNEALIQANILNQRLCGTPVRQVTYLAGPPH